MRKIRIAGIPTGKITGGSVRIRYYTFLSALDKLEFEIVDNCKDADIFYVQKKSTKDVIELVKELKKKGVKIVYDLDDGDGYRDKKDRYDKKMFVLADAITTDTEMRAEAFRKKTDKPIHVVQDCIDYGIKFEDRIDIREKIICGGTFGTHKVLEATYDQANYVLNSAKKEYVTDRKIIKYNNWEWKKWSLDTFVNILKKWDICVLSHPKNDIGGMKSNNRLLVCMALGIPTFVSNTFAYSNTMKAMGFEWLIVYQNILPVAALFDPIMRKSVSTKMHMYVWKNYSPEISGKQLENVFRSVL
jgi:predicted peroxiredoxin